MIGYSLDHELSINTGVLHEGRGDSSFRSIRDGRTGVRCSVVGEARWREQTKLIFFKVAGELKFLRYKQMGQNLKVWRYIG